MYHVAVASGFVAAGGGGGGGQGAAAVLPQTKNPSEASVWTVVYKGPLNPKNPEPYTPGAPSFFGDGRICRSARTLVNL